VLLSHNAFDAVLKLGICDKIAPGQLEVLAAINARPPATANLRSQHYGLGRELFGAYRALVSSADTGASLFNPDSNPLTQPMNESIKNPL